MTGQSEKAVLNEALIAITAEPHTMAWRNNTGMAWQGAQVKVRTGQLLKIEPGMVVLREARPIKFGLPGSGDIIGITRGWGFSLEAKATRGRMETSQPKFQAAWEKAGGEYALFRSVEEAVAVPRRLLLRGE